MIHQKGRGRQVKKVPACAKNFVFLSATLSKNSVTKNLFKKKKKNKKNKKKKKKKKKNRQTLYVFQPLLEDIISQLHIVSCGRFLRMFFFAFLEYVS